MTRALVELSSRDINPMESRIHTVCDQPLRVIAPPVHSLTPVVEPLLLWIPVEVQLAAEAVAEGEAWAAG